MVYITVCFKISPVSHIPDFSQNEKLFLNPQLNHLVQGLPHATFMPK